MNSRNISSNKWLVSITKKFIFLFGGLLLWFSLSAQPETELNPDGIVFPRLDSLGVNNSINGTVIYDTATAQLIYYNGVKWMAVGGPFEKVGTLVRPRTGQNVDDFIFGRDALPENGENVFDTFFFFDKSKNAFRGGRVNSTGWSPDSIGANSFAYGESVKASGIGSLAMGTYTSSLGNYGSMAFGHLSEATGDNGSIAMGLGCEASGITGSSAIGYSCSARGSFGNTAIGYFTFASGDTASTAIGFGATASGDKGATAIGYTAQAGGDAGATAIGYLTIASGNEGATALGSGSFSDGNVGCTAIGYNTISVGDSGATAIGYLTQAYGLKGATALGEETIATGNFGATALGSGSSASGDGGATALGLATQAIGHAGATALGNSTMATGNIGATALGYLSNASGESGATALGYNTVASGDFGATALGFYAEASGNDGAISLGVSTLASGNNGAIAMGNGTQALGDDGSMALGVGTIATGNSCTVVGLYNDTIVTTGSVISSTSPIFIIGNGTAGVGNESNAMVIRKDGNVSIGNANPLVRLQVGSNGDGTVARANAWNLFSDRRFKQDIIPLSNALNLVNQLEGRSFEWKTNGKKDMGFIAQEVEAVVDYIVTTDSDGFKSLDYGKIMPLLVEAIKELTAEVEALKKQK